jgi:hypothetical protein
MAKIRRVAIGDKAWKDVRGWVLNPLPLAGLEGKTLGNLHVASMQPGAALITGAEEILVGGGEPELFEIPAGLPHAIVNRSEREIFLVVFYEEKDLDTAPVKII